MMVCDNSGNAVRIGRPPPEEKRVERARIGRRRKRVAGRGGDLDDAVPAGRRPHDAANRREAVRVEKARGDAVGGDHEIFDQRLGAIRHLGLQIAQRVAVEVGPRLDRRELERSQLVASAAEGLSDAVLKLQLRVDSRRRRRRFGQGAAARQPRIDAVVGQLGVIAYARAIDVGALERPVRRHDQLDDDRQPILSGIERREIGRQPLGKHRKDDARRVDRGRVDGRVAIEQRALADHGRRRRRWPPGPGQSPPASASATDN